MGTLVAAGQRLALLEKDLFESYADNASISLMTGNGGLPLLYYNLYKATGLEEYRDKAGLVLEHIIDRIMSGITSYTYCEGLAGIAALFAYLREKEFVNDSIDSFVSQCDDVLYRTFFQLSEKQEMDYLHGALGIAVYLLHRFRTGHISREKLDLVAHAVVLQLNNTTTGGAVHNEYVPGTPDAADTRYINCGMAHGLVSSVIFLAGYCEVTSDETEARNAIKKATDVLLSFRSPASNNAESVFPSIVKLSDGAFDTTYKIPLGWCYGDTVVSIGLHYAAHVLEDDKLASYARSLALQTTQRATRKEAIIYDACFCHGTTGLSHIYKKWYAITGIPEFRDSYEHWIRETLDLTKFPAGVGGYLKFEGGSYEAQYGLLDGACGVAMVLTDYVYRGTEDWDRFFLLS
ncbi:MAG TPA: lanthionine synthetase C family protein [Chitinophaga sp.]|uniref:lanthionine synthetase C family protein n=1 Tax=Chitinophaga sp. TaxID=1869181 RepID=UPI002B909872|nr:lanthionine synthetase C family protein [Chitinophaga sp.]HVI46002.1 lanthionine synthetase C family protein [Chitinophaga sp.]